MANESLPRSSHKPRTYRFTGENLDKSHENKHFAVTLATTPNGLYTHPAVILVPAAANVTILGELLEVDVENKEVAVQVEGRMYLRSDAAYGGGNDNGRSPISDTDGTAGIVEGGPLGTKNRIHIDGGGTAEVDGEQVNVLRCWG